LAWVLLLADHPLNLRWHRNLAPVDFRPSKWVAAINHHIFQQDGGFELSKLFVFINMVAFWLRS